MSSSTIIPNLFNQLCRKRRFLHASATITNSHRLLFHVSSLTASLSKPQQYRQYPHQQQLVRYKKGDAFFSTKHTPTRRRGVRNRPQRATIPSSSSALKPSSVKWLQRQRKDEYVLRAKEEGSPSRALYKLQQIDEIVMNRKNMSKTNNKTQTSQQNKKCGIFKQDQTVVDLGAAPGGWSLYASSKVGRNGKVIAVDLLNLDPTTLTKFNTNQSRTNLSSAGTFHFIQGDFRSPLIQQQIVNALLVHASSEGGSERETTAAHKMDAKMMVNDGAIIHGADVIMSDMAANFTGDKTTDALRTLSLCEDALVFAIGKSCFDVSPATLSSSGTTADIAWQDRGLLRVGGTFLCKFFACGQDNEADLMEAVCRYFDTMNVLKPKASRIQSAEQYLVATGYRGNRVN